MNTDIVDEGGNCGFMTCAAVCKKALLFIAFGNRFVLNENIFVYPVRKKISF